MFVKLTRINTQDHEKELLVDTNEIAFVSECEPKIDYETVVGKDSQGNYSYKTTEYFLVAFKGGNLPPQTIDRDSYDTLVKILAK